MENEAATATLPTTTAAQPSETTRQAAIIAAITCGVVLALGVCGLIFFFIGVFSVFCKMYFTMFVISYLQGAGSMGPHFGSHECLIGNSNTISFVFLYHVLFYLFNENFTKNYNNKIQIKCEFNL